MVYDEKGLKLIYVLKIGYNSKDEGLFEFIFSKDEQNIDIEKWCWDLIPACDNAEPPEEDYIDAIFSLKTKNFDLFCLHEAVDREYMHGYHTIHALAYEIDRELDSFDDYTTMFETDDDNDAPLLVFHYGMTLENVKNLLNDRKIILKNNEFVETSSLKF
jgi:hypothetical protein